MSNRYSPFVSETKPGLEFSFPNLVKNEGTIQIIRTDDDTYSAMRSGDANQLSSVVSIGNIIGAISLDSQTALLSNASTRNIDIKMERPDLKEQHLQYLSENPRILSEDPITKFYVCSIYVLGLYVFYRLLVINK